jgi:hypothetical protein
MGNGVCWLYESHGCMRGTVKKLEIKTAHYQFNSYTGIILGHMVD